MQLPRGTERQSKASPPEARWMTRAELAQNAYRMGEAAILLGRDGDVLIGSKDDRHLMTIAGSRAGKSSTCLKPNLLLWPSSLLCIDPKGELARDTAVARARMGQDVYVLDPFGEVTGPAAEFRRGYNPLDELRMAREIDVIDDAALLAEALIVPDKGGDQHWTLSAKNLVRGLTLFTLMVARDGGTTPTLPLIRRMVTSPLESASGQPSLMTIFEHMLRAGHTYGGVLAGVGGTMQGKPRDERGSIISTAVEQTAFLDSLPMQRHLADPGLPSLRLLKHRPTTIYLVLPASRMATHFRWLRLILTLALAALEREPMKLDAPVLFVLEEFPQLGYMRQIEAAAGLMAGYHVKLWTILQDLSQIKALYKDSWETFIGNAGVVQAFGNTDSGTLEYVSRRLGTLPIVETEKARLTPSSISAGAHASPEQRREVPLLAPFEIAQYTARETGKQVVMHAGKQPAYIDRLSHEHVSKLGMTAKGYP